MTRIPIIEVREAELPGDLGAVRKLWLDYLTWGNNEMQSRHGMHPHTPSETVEQDIAMIAKFQPPGGSLVLAYKDGEACGIGCLHRIGDGIGEIKRMYVDPSFRGGGAGRAILEKLLITAHHNGYGKVRLDSTRFMTAAHAMYRRFGFKDIEAYPESEIPEQFRPFLVFMELEL